MAGECIECNRPIMCADCDDLLRAHMIYGIHSPGLARRIALEAVAEAAKTDRQLRSSASFDALGDALAKLERCP